MFEMFHLFQVDEINNYLLHAFMLNTCVPALTTLLIIVLFGNKVSIGQYQLVIKAQ